MESLNEQTTSSTVAVEDSTQVRTFLIADVRGYTRFTVEHGDEAAAKLARRFAELANEVVSRREGEVIELRGDEALVVFTSARQALRASIELQDRFLLESSENPDIPLRVGIGLDSGEAIPVDEGFRGAALNLAARLCALAGGGEILASDTVSNLARKIEGVDYADRGTVQLKGFGDPIRVVEVQDAAKNASLPSASDSVTERPLPIGGFLGALPAGMLVARERELQRILSAVDRVAGGTGQLVLLAGEPGAGKTRLAQEVTLAVRNRAFLLAAGSCYEPRQSVPYYPFLDVLSSLYGSAPKLVRSVVGERWPYLGRLLPEAGIAVPAPSEGQEEQERLFRAITGFVQAVAEQVPVAILLDDLHWADAASLDLLQHLARQTRAYRVLLLGTYRDVEVGRQHPLERALRDLNRQQLIERIPVRRLEQNGTADLVALSFGQEQISDEFAELVHRHTEGNPFFTQEVLRALVERGDIYREDGHWERREISEIEVPESVRSTIGERLSRLPEDAQELLREASVLGQSFGFEVLQGMGDREEKDLEAALDESVAAGLVRETGRDEYGFNHALTQQALYGELSGRRRRRLHLAAGEALEKLPAPARDKRVPELAWHFLEGDDPDRALKYAMAAGEQAEKVFAVEEAKQHYRSALEVAREIGDHGRLAPAVFKLALALAQSGEREGALPLFEEARQFFAELDDPVGQGQCFTNSILIYHAQGRTEEAQAMMSRTEELIKLIAAAPASREKALFYQHLGHAYFTIGRYGDRLQMSDTGLAVAESLGDAELVLRMRAERLIPLFMLGRGEETLLETQNLISELDKAGQLPTLVVALSHVAEDATFRGDFQTAQSYREREAALDRRLGNMFELIVCEANTAWLWVLQGNWRLARERVELALSLAKEEGNVWASQFPPMQLGHLSLWQGDWETARENLAAALAVVQPIDDFQGMRWASHRLAELDLLEGNPRAAVARLEPLLDRPGLQEHDVTTFLPVLAWAYLDSGELGKARQVVTEAAERANKEGNKLALVDALRVQGMVFAQQERWAEADAAFEEDIALARPMPYPYAEARALFDWGKVLLSRQKSGGEDGELQRQARQRIEEALHIFQRLGAKKDVERAEQTLAHPPSP